MATTPAGSPAGLVNREVAAHDRGRIQLSLTEEGAHLAQQIVEIEKELY